MKAIITVCCLVGLVGCATPNQKELTENTRPPLPDDYKQQAEKAIKSSLKDPWSAVLEFRDPPREGWVRTVASRGGKLHLGWFVPVHVNAKNGFGGYAGFQLWWTFYSEAGWGGYEPNAQAWLNGTRYSAGFSDSEGK